ncbi:MAG: hypothetical protein JOZ12_10885 [Sinobacteraceae bacterium]|nr:hypothetical protein [Nevskiaceae bacterium]
MRVVSIRLLSMLGLLALLNYATMGIGTPITGEQGKLSISNLTPILFVTIAGSWYLLAVRAVPRTVIAFLGAFNICALVSYGIYMLRYGWPPNVMVLLFQNVEIIFSLLLFQYARDNPQEFLRVVRIGIFCSAVISALFGLHHFIYEAADFKRYHILNFSMDDKSQAAVLFCCQAYLLLRLYGGKLDRLVAGGLLAMSFMTLSRLPLAFVPVLCVALAVRTRYGWVVIASVVCAIVGLVVVAGDAIVDVFKILDRLSSITTATGDESTSAHLLLIETALQMKFSGLTALIFGTGPGNFSHALTSFSLDLTHLEAVDPQLVVEARNGRAPMHSTPVSLLLDYNIAIFFLIFFLFLRALRFLLTERKYLDFSFVMSLFAASMFYSVHNKPYVFVAVATLAAVLAPKGATRPKEAPSAMVASPAT